MASILDYALAFPLLLAPLATEQVRHPRSVWLWLQFQWRRLVAWLFPSTLRFGYDVPAREMDKQTLAAHVQAVRDFFPRAEADGLRGLLPQSRFPSEELLREFLTQIGLPPLYAYLSYDYLEDFGRDELAENGIVPLLDLE